MSAWNEYNIIMCMRDMSCEKLEKRIKIRFALEDVTISIRHSPLRVFKVFFGDPIRSQGLKIGSTPHLYNQERKHPTPMWG